jgi:cytochrome c556
MKFLMKAAVVCALGLSGVAYAQEATDPNVQAWQTLMKANGAAAKVLGDMATAKAPYDAAAAEAAKAKLIEDAAAIPATFETQATDPASESKPEIWTNWEDFVVKANALGTAAAALDTASVETIGAGMGAIGAACSDCHKAYRVMN